MELKHFRMWNELVQDKIRKFYLTWKTQGEVAQFPVPKAYVKTLDLYRNYETYVW